MKEIVKMVVILTILSSFSGGLLAFVKNSTKDKIEYQQLIFEKAPAIKKILPDVSNDPLTDRFKLKDGEKEITFFVGITDGTPAKIVFENFGKGYGGEFGIMVGINIEDNSIEGIGITTHSETPGMGAKAKDEPYFSGAFVSLPANGKVSLRSDGGNIDAITGATITSRAVCNTVSNAGQLYTRFKPQLLDKLKDYPKANHQ